MNFLINKIKCPEAESEGKLKEKPETKSLHEGGFIIIYFLRNESTDEIKNLN